MEYPYPAGTGVGDLSPPKDDGYSLVLSKSTLREPLPHFYLSHIIYNYNPASRTRSHLPFNLETTADGALYSAVHSFARYL